MDVGLQEVFLCFHLHMLENFLLYILPIGISKKISADVCDSS